MKFKIIPNRQTPEITSLITAEEILRDHYKLMVKFLSFSTRQHLCVGLASNQVSCDGERIMIPFFSIKDNHFWDIVISPEIMEFRGKPKEEIEGCLTWLGKDIIAERYPEISARYWNFKGLEIRETLTGFKAQVFQHEYNHLRGINEIVRSRRKQ